MGYDKDKEVRKRAKKIGLCEIESNIEKVNDSELIILCVPVGQMQAVIQRLKNFIEPGTIITDVGSVKLSVIKELEAHTGR